jgi:hypothetical protein
MILWPPEQGTMCVLFMLTAFGTRDAPQNKVNIFQ